MPSTEIPPTPTPEPEIADILLSIDAELTQETCAGYDPIVGGMVTVSVTTEDGNLDGIGRVEFYVEDELIDTVTEPPYLFEGDATIYDDGDEITLRVDAYDWVGTLHQSDSMVLRVDNTPEPTLKSLGEKAGLEIGTIDESQYRGFSSAQDSLYFETLCQNFDMLVVGAYMWFTQPQQGVWDYSTSDSTLKFAQENQMKIHVHPLVWGGNLDWEDPETDWMPSPRWLHRGDFSREEMIDLMYAHIQNVMLHWQGQVDAWIAVNESYGGFDGSPPVALKNTVWTQKLGDDYVELAFKYADTIDPDVKLVLNEVNADYLGQYGPWDTRVDGFYQFTKELIEKGTPIDVVGFQFHWIVGEDDPTVEDVVGNFARYGELGLEVYITELDVRIEEPVTEEKLEEQARLYAIALQACLESEYCTSFTVWSHTDKYSWITDSFPGFAAAHVFDENMQPKPAYYALIEVLQNYLANQ